MTTKWQELQEHLAKLSKEPTIELECPTCGMPPFAKCVAKRKKGFGEPKYAPLHRTRNEREIYEREFHAKSQQEMQESMKAQMRERRIAEGLTPEPHDEFCLCDEECYPHRLEEVEFELQWTEEQLNRAQGLVNQAQDSAEKLDALRLRWKIDHGNT